MREGDVFVLTRLSRAMCSIQHLLEETGLRCVIKMIGRVHPATGVLMVQVAAELAREPRAMPDTTDELPEVSGSMRRKPAS